MQTLLLRIITAVILLAVLYVAFFVLPPPAAVIALGFFVLVGAWEWSGFFGAEGPLLRLAYGGFIFALMVGSERFIPEPLALAPVLWIGVIWWSVAFVWVLRYPTPIRRDVAAVCGVLTLLPAWVALLALLRATDRGIEYLLFVLVIIWAADIGAYFTGRRFGRTKLAVEVSPGKTWEGVAGGLAAAGLVAAIGARWLDLPALILVPVGLSVAAISVVGDLTVSMFKRHAHLKDSGSLFPGHGGVLDRVDSITAGVPLFALIAVWMGIIAN